LKIFIQVLAYEHNRIFVLKGICFQIDITFNTYKHAI